MGRFMEPVCHSSQVFEKKGTVGVSKTTASSAGLDVPQQQVTPKVTPETYALAMCDR